MSSALKRLLRPVRHLDRRSTTWSQRVAYALEHPDEFPPPGPNEVPNPIGDQFYLRVLANDPEAGEAEYRRAVAAERTARVPRLSRTRSTTPRRPA